MADKVTTTYEIGEGLKIEDNKLKVDSIDEAIESSKKPITSHGVALEIGNLEVLLKTV